jgi:DNA-binding IclR family transcriptional regulator
VAILKHLSKSGEPIGVTRLARELGLSASTCFNLLNTLTEEGLVEFDEQSKTYSIGMGLIAYTRQILGKDPTIALLRRGLEHIAAHHGATTFLVHQVTPTRMVAPLVCIGDGPVSIHMHTGQRMPVLSGAGGRIMAAFGELDDDFLRREFQQVRWGKPLSFEVFCKQVEQARRKGWAIDDGFLVPGALDVAVPAFDRNGRMHFACGAMMFGASKNNQERILAVVKDLLDVANLTDPRRRVGTPRK